MENKPLRLAVLGVGYLGRFHAQKIKAHPGAELVGVFDARAEQAQAVAQELGVRVFSSLEELFKNVEAVSIASTTLTHFELASKALEARLHVNVEKPMTATLEQSETLVKLAKSVNRFLTVGHIERFNPSVVWLKEEMRKKQQVPRFIELHRMAPFRLRGADVSAVYDLMIHDLDLLFHLGGSGVASRTLQGQKIISTEFDAVQGFFELKSGVKAFIHVNRSAPSIQRTMKVVFQDEVIFLNTQTHEIQRAIPVDRNAAEPMKMESIQVPKTDALAEEIHHFIQSLRGEIQPLVTAEDGLEAVRECEVITQLLEKGGLGSPTQDRPFGSDSTSNKSGRS